MKLTVATFGRVVELTAEADTCWLRSLQQGPDLSQRSGWPPEALQAPRGQTTALEIEQLLELGLAESFGRDVRIPYASFPEMDRLEMGFGRAWVPWSPFLLQVDRHSDLGRADFEYRYRFLEGTRPVALTRVGCFIRFDAREATFRLDGNTHALVEAMDAFNALPAEDRRQSGWLTFSKVKELSRGIGARLDRALASNDVVVPSVIGLEMVATRDGALSFRPTCPDLPGCDFGAVFHRNRQVGGVYSVDAEGGRRVRVVLGEPQQEVLKRMKRAQGLRGEAAESARADPASFFDGVLDSVDIPYGPRVAGVGAFEFASVPRPVGPGRMGDLFGREGQNDVPPTPPPTAAATLVARGPDGAERRVQLEDEQARAELRTLVARALASGAPSVVFRNVEFAVDQELAAALEGDAVQGTARRTPGAYLLIYTDEEEIRSADALDVARTLEQPVPGDARFEAALALVDPGSLKPHQEDGVRWLETCARHPGRRGVLLADDMGLGKTFQVLAFIAKATETGLFPDLSHEGPPWRPVLVIVPLILLENETWQGEMRRFFRDGGSIFQPVLALHGPHLNRLRLDDAGREVQIGRPVLDLDALQRNRVVITTYDTVKNYQHSFACLRNGKSLWSLVVSDEAQEYKTPNSKVSHALKALDPDFHIASTGTPVENRLLDLWNLFDTLQPALLGPAREFSRRYEETADQDISVSDLREQLLMGRSHAFLLRRDKSTTVGLPAKHEHRLECDLTPGEIQLHREIVAGGSGGETSSKLSALHRLSQLYQHPALLQETEVAPGRWAEGSAKLRRVIEELRKIQRRSEKAILFARHIRSQQMLAAALSEEFGIAVRIINGETQLRVGHSGRDSRRGILDAFRSTPGFGLLVLSPFVAGVGLTITEANHVFHYGRWWNPAVEAQATDRVYRLGQEREVHVYLPILRDPSKVIARTFDEALDELIGSKRRLAFDFLRPVDTEKDAAYELFASLGSDSSSTPDRLTESDLDALSPEDFTALVAYLLRESGATVEKPQLGQAPGASLLARNAGVFRVIRVVEAHRAADETDVAVAAEAREVLIGLGHTEATAEVWTVKPVERVRAAAHERGVTVISRAVIAQRLSSSPVAHRDIWRAPAG